MPCANQTHGHPRNVVALRRTGCIDKNGWYHCRECTREVRRKHGGSQPYAEKTEEQKVKALAASAKWRASPAGAAWRMEHPDRRDRSEYNRERGRPKARQAVS